jgi:hypothetical protein
MTIEADLPVCRNPAKQTKSMTALMKIAIPQEIGSAEPAKPVRLRTLGSACLALRPCGRHEDRLFGRARRIPDSLAKLAGIFGERAILAAGTLLIASSVLFYGLAGSISAF